MNSRLTGIAAVIALSLVAHQQAHAQLRYMVSLDVQEQYSSNVFAGAQSEPGLPDPEQWDLITVLEPAVRLYYNWPRNLLYSRYAFRFQFHTMTRDTQGTAQTDDDGLLFGYANELHLGYNRMFSRRTELALINRFRQGTETTSAAGYTGSNGAAQFGFMTTGSSYFSDTLEASLHHQLSPNWSLTPRLVGEAHFPYDLIVHEQLIPPPMNQAVTASVRLQRAFSIGALSLIADGSYIHEYYSQDVEQFGSAPIGDPTRVARFPSDLHSVVAALSLLWRHQLNEQWDYTLGAGIDVRLIQEYTAGDAATGAGAENLGFGEPGFGPIGEASLRYRWRRTLGVTLSYSHRTRRLIENAVSTATETDEVGLDAYIMLQSWRFEVFGAFRYMHNTNRAVGQTNQEDLDDTMLGRARALVVYAIMPGLSVEAGYELELADSSLAFFVNDQQIDPSLRPEVRPSSYARHQVTVGVSFAWPPPPPQDLRFNRRESEYDPVFLRDGTAAAEDTVRDASAESGQSVEQQRECAEDPQRADCDPNNRPNQAPVP